MLQDLKKKRYIGSDEERELLGVGGRVQEVPGDKGGEGKRNSKTNSIQKFPGGKLMLCLNKKQRKLRY